MNVDTVTSSPSTAAAVARPTGHHHGGGREKTMQAVADTLGMDPEDLKKALTGGETMSGLAANIANGQRPGRAEKSRPDVAQGIQALSSALGISGHDLLDRLTDGTGIADLLAKNPDVSAQLAQSQNRGALVDGYS